MAHTHNIVDDDKHFVIDPVTRSITNLSGSTVYLMQYDHNSERFTFEIPRGIEGHDVSISDTVEIHYTNTGSGTSVSRRASNSGVYQVDNLTIDSEDDEKVVFSWLISQNATLFAGAVKFQLKFKCYNAVSTDVPDYIWSSDMFEDVVVRPGLNNIDAIESLYPDIIKNMNDRIDKFISLPEVTKADEGKMVMVENGEWVARHIENYEEVEF